MPQFVTSETYPCMDTSCTGTMRPVFECNRCGLQHPGDGREEFIYWHPASEAPAPAGKDFFETSVLFICSDEAQSGFYRDGTFYNDEHMRCVNVRWWAYLPTGPKKPPA